jgi:hypothetical protein
MAKPPIIERDRYRGVLLGLACIDAFGTRAELKPRGTFALPTCTVARPRSAWRHHRKQAQRRVGHFGIEYRFSDCRKAASVEISHFLALLDGSSR